MKITFLGVWMVPVDGDTVSFVLELDSGEKILVDSGVNTVRNLINANIDPCSITHLVITHSHGDHIAGLPVYLFYRYKYAPLVNKKVPSSLKIISTQDTWEAVKAYINIPYPNLINDPNIIIEEYVREGSSLKISEHYMMNCFITNHNPITFGFKIINTFSKKSIVYSADTAICKSVFDMAEDTDCLIHDVVADSKFPMLGKAGHSLCNDVGELSNNSRVRMLVPVHRLPIYKGENDKYKEELSNVFHGKLFIPMDGDVIEI